MDSIPKRPKPPQEASIEEQTLDDDFISNLPDSIICHILSKLPTKHAVATAILSSRWKNLFSLIPNLNLNFNDSLILHPVDEANPNPVDRTASFISFVYRVLNVILHDVSHINQFGLNCDQDYDDTHIIAWICAALHRKVSFLDLEITMKSPILLLDNLCGCTTLKHLTLGKHLVLDVPGSFCLPNLKYLWLENVEFLGEQSVPDLLTGCPVLEDLFMFNCDLNCIFLNISIPSLKGLIIENCFDEEIGYDMVLDTPALEMLMYTDFVADKYWVMNMGSVLKVHIDVGPTEEQLEEDSVRYNQNVAALVTASSTVDSLFLSKVSITAFHRSCRPMPLFRNLIHLMLGGFGIDGWDLLPLLLESAPNLEFLDITEGFYDENGCYARFESRLSESVAACLSLHLKKIDIREFKGEEDEFKLVEYFLKSAKVLNKIKIHSDLSWPTIICIQKRVLMLPKLSETCQILLYKSD